ncbi:DUF6904 family protein [Niabella hirudinis]|uniref:DUF6904 family protein n=1 Tax=Niabella hirudinis TaxID=1285929 RepID=UPI003EB7771F
MIYIIPTGGGMGVELWGTYGDLYRLYEIIGKFWAKEDKNGPQPKASENRDKAISAFSYEIRKAFQGSRLEQPERGHFHYSDGRHLGVQISWVHFLFSLTAIKFNMRYSPTDKEDIGQILLLEYWLEKAMFDYDAVGAQQLSGFIEDGLYGGNPHIYQYMRRITYDFFVLGGGKMAFRKLPQLLKKGIFFSESYKEYEAFLKKEAQRLNCDSSELELGDDNFDYDSIKW